MRQFVASLLTTDGPASAIELYAIEQILTEKSGALLLDRLGVPSGPHAATRARAIAVIVEQCGDRSLTPTRVAREIHVSLRQLHLVFSESGNQIAREIRRHRARLAHSLLVDSRYDLLSMDQIGHRAGFPSAASLRRALDESYASAPSALRSRRQLPPLKRDGAEAPAADVPSG